MFNSKEFLNDYYIQLNKLADEISQKHLLKLKTKKINQYKTGFEDAYRKVIGKQSAKQVFKIRFGTSALKAFITEFGSGSRMVSAAENPFLSRYLSSNVYNPARSRSMAGRNKVVTWGKSSYITYNWDGSGVSYVKRSGGSFPPGLDVEFGRGGSRNTYGYEPRKAHFFLRATLAECKKDLLFQSQMLFVAMLQNPKYYQGEAGKMFRVDVSWS